MYIYIYIYVYIHNIFLYKHSNIHIHLIYSSGASRRCPKGGCQWYRLQGHGRRTNRILLSILLLTSDVRTNRAAGRPGWVEVCSGKKKKTRFEIVHSPNIFNGKPVSSQNLKIHRQNMSFERCGPVTYVRNSVWLCSKKYPESRSAMEKSLESLDWSLAFLTWKLLVTCRTVAWWIGLMFGIHLQCSLYITCMRK